jgi:hypothetical protein
MLVKIVNLTDNRFRNCRSTNSNNEFTSFYGLSTDVRRHMPHISTADLDSLLPRGKNPHVSLNPETPPSKGKGKVHEVTEEDADKAFGGGTVDPEDDPVEYQKALREYQLNRGRGDGYD